MKDVIIVVGGDSERRIQLANKLNCEQHNVIVCQSSEVFNTRISEDKIIAVLLLYPDEFGVIDELFDSNVISGLFGTVPVVLISSSPAENNRARSLHYGADEFLIEPIASKEIFNIIYVLNRSSLQNNSHKILAIGDLALHRASLTVTLRHMKLPLHPLQVRILEFLMRNPGRTFTRREISNSVWRTDISIEDRTIDVSIGRIRDALKHKVTVDPIRTVRSVGYAFNEQFDQTSSLPRKGRGIRRHERRRVGRVDD